MHSFIKLKKTLNSKRLDSKLLKVVENVNFLKLLKPLLKQQQTNCKMPFLSKI